MTKKNNKGGRPPKFNEPRRPITVTLPERTLEALSAISHDRAKAIVKLTTLIGAGKTASHGLELVEIMHGKAIIVVGPSKALRSISWLRLAEVAPLRYLLVIPTGKAVESLEIEIRDLLDTWHGGSPGEREMLEKLRHLISTNRRNSSLSRAELLFVSM